jgi:hypothetical protein
MEAHWVVRFQYILDTCPLTGVRISVLLTGRLLPAGRFMVINSARGLVSSGVIVQLKGLGQLKIPMTSSEIKHVTLWLLG